MELYLLCIMVFLCRIVDVSLGSIRTILIVKNRKLWASLIGFVEVLFWFLIVREALTSDEKSILVAIAYATGFAVGTFVGMKLSDKFITGIVSVQAVLSDKDDKIIDIIRENGYGVSVITTKGKDKETYMIMMEIDKKLEKEVKDLIKSLDPDAFISIKESKMVYNGFFK